MIRPAAVALAAAALATIAAPHAGAAPAATAVRDAEQAYQLAVPRGWTEVAPLPPGVVAAWRSPDDAHVAAIARVEAGKRTLGTGEATAAALERGVARATPGFRRTARRLSRDGDFDLVDLAYRRDDPGGRDVVRVRFVVLNSRTLSLTIASRPRAPARVADAVVASFRPHLP